MTAHARGLTHIEWDSGDSPATSLLGLRKVTRMLKTDVFRLRLTPDDRAAWAAAADSRGLTVSEWIRKLADEGAARAEFDSWRESEANSALRT